MSNKKSSAWYKSAGGATGALAARELALFWEETQQLSWELISNISSSSWQTSTRSASLIAFSAVVKHTKFKKTQKDVNRIRSGSETYCVMWSNQLCWGGQENSLKTSASFTHGILLNSHWCGGSLFFFHFFYSVSWLSLYRFSILKALQWLFCWFLDFLNGIVIFNILINVELIRRYSLTVFLAKNIIFNKYFKL